MKARYVVLVALGALLLFPELLLAQQDPEQAPNDFFDIFVWLKKAFGLVEGSGGYESSGYIGALLRFVVNCAFTVAMVLGCWQFFVLAPVRSASTGNAAAREGWWASFRVFGSIFLLIDVGGNSTLAHQALWKATELSSAMANKAFYITIDYLQNNGPLVEPLHQGLKSARRGGQMYCWTGMQLHTVS